MKKIKPMLAKRVEEPFDKEGWIFEVKWDGYRAITEIENGKIEIYSRNGLDFSASYIPVVKALEKLKKNDLVLDGEIVALKGGKPDFHTLQDYHKHEAQLVYAIFDLLYLNGKDLRDLPLIQRKEKLRKILPKKDNILLFSEHVETHGKKFFETMRKKHMEGMMAKEASSKYLENVRSPSWLKIKNVEEQEAIIIGFTEPRGGRKFMGALVLGAYINKKLTYIGHSGGGFTESELKEIVSKLKKVKTETPTVKEKIKINSLITWVKPVYVCQVKFTEWTQDGRMRHPIYAGLRLDKKAKEVVREVAEKALPKIIRPDVKTKETVEISNREKIFWPKEKYTKGDVIDYYEKISDLILPYLKDRPQNLLRHPNGIKDKGFFQKDITFSVPDYVEIKKIWSESNNSYLHYMVCQNKETLLYMANLGCIELNPWNSKTKHLDKPDYMILDIDPDKNSHDELIEVAEETHKILNLVCEDNYIKTSGKRGLHICVPLGAQYTYDQIRPFAEILARLVNKRLPKITSIERIPKKRKGKIYIDYLQNRRGQTLASVYSLRPAESATVSTPLLWSELKKYDPKDFNILSIPERIKEKGDLWKPVLEKSIDLRDSIKCLEEHFHLE